MRRLLLLSLLLTLLSGCAGGPSTSTATPPPSFAPVPGKAVIFVVRAPVGGNEQGGVALDDTLQVSTWAGSYVRWEVAPGTHRLRPTGQAASGGVTLSTVAGGVYYFQHIVYGNERTGPTTVVLQEISAGAAQQIIQRSQPISS